MERWQRGNPNPPWERRPFPTYCERDVPPDEYFSYPGVKPKSRDLVVESNTIYEIDYDCLACRRNGGKGVT